jgi:hypothetical protein
MQDKAAYPSEETSSPTVSLTSIYIVMAVCALERRCCGTMDIGSAYLNADMVREVTLSVQPNLAKMLVNIDSVYGSYINQNGTSVVKLEKALYGCLESAKLWHEELSRTMLGQEFVANSKDKCVFNLQRAGHQITARVYVDDILCTSIDPEDIKWIHRELKSKYGEVSVNYGNVYSYLGQTFDLRTDGEYRVNMEGYINDVLELYGVTGSRVTPATEVLSSITEDLHLLNDDTTEEFHSRVAKL